MTRADRMFPADRITLREVGLRDGLQLVRQFPDTRAKQEWLQREYDAGVRYFELGSFLPAQRFPQFADVRALIEAAGRLPGLRGAALVLNERGAVHALQTPIDELVFVLSATESHSQANTRRTRQAAVDLLRRIVQMRDDGGGAEGPLVTAGIAMAFGCSLEGSVDPDEVLRLVDACAEAGADVIALADTVGYAVPRAVATLVSQTRRRIGAIPVGLHLHDTRGMAIANAAVALDEGVRLLDGSLGGLGGCPFAPGATGNIVFEDLVFLCENQGFNTGIDMEKLIQVREVVARSMPDEPLSGALAKAGLPRISSQVAV